MANNVRESARRRAGTRHGEGRRTRSVTQTIRPPPSTVAGPSSSTTTRTFSQNAAPVGQNNETQPAVLRLHLTRRARVRWTKDTHDNEHDGKKSSKSCCIFHKNRSWDESSSESGEDPSDDDNDENGEKDQGNSSSRDRRMNVEDRGGSSGRSSTNRNGHGGSTQRHRSHQTAAEPRQENPCETHVDSDGSSSSGGPIARPSRQNRKR